MYLQGQACARRIFIVAFMVLLGVCGSTAFGQDTTGQAGTDSAAPATPVLPANSTGDANSGNVAKAAPLPSTDATASRVGNVRPDSYVIGTGDALDINVWKEGELSKLVGVRPDGMITMPL